MFNNLFPFLQNRLSGALVKEQQKQIIIDTIKTITTISIDPNVVSVRATVVSIHSSPVLKTEIKLNESKILSSLKEKNIIITSIR